MLCVVVASRAGAGACSGLALLVVFDDGRRVGTVLGGLPPRAKCERMALVALDVAGRIEVIIVARRDVFTGQEPCDVEADDLSRIVVCRRGFDAFQEARDQTQVEDANKTHESIKRPDGNATPDEAIEFSLKDLEVAEYRQQLGFGRNCLPRLAYK